VDDPDQLAELVAALDEIAAHLPMFLPLHPRTRKNLDRFGLAFERVTVSGPIPYLEFLGLMADAAVVLTDSGGIQEETTVLGVPCLTLRPHTERPITITEGTNRLVTERTRERIVEAVEGALADPPKARRPEL
jgi:UDP-N-acetylglucosamine 2-epimerase (non-hydrolysing)